MRMRTVLAVCAIASAPAVASAQDAATLYKKGLAAMEAGKLAQACPMLEKSYEKDQRLPTLFAVALCEEKQKKASPALEHYKAYLERVKVAPPAEQQKEGERRKHAEQQVELMERGFPELTLVMPPAPPEGTILKLDGRAQPSLSNIRVSPGDHVVSIEVSDGRKFEMRVSVAAGERKKVQLELPAKPTEIAVAASEPPDELPPEEAPPLPEKDEPGAAPARPTSKVGAFVVGGVGVAGLAVGSVFGIMAMKKASIIDQHCVDILCDAEGKKAAKDGRVDGWISTGAFVVGVIGVGAAVYMLASGSSPSKSASAAPSVHGWQPLVAGSERGDGAWIGARRSF